MQPRATGALKSKYDIRTFTYNPLGLDTAYIDKGGFTYEPEYIEDQHSVGICTAISMTMNARRSLGIDFSDDFQYLIQKKYVDGNWNEGSSGFSACTAAYKYGLLPAKEWKHTTIEDRKLPYHQYIAKLQAIPQSEIDRLLKISANYKIQGYAKIVPLTRDTLANAIYISKAGVLARFVVGSEWWTSPIEPLRPAKAPISGHLINISKFVGNSFRIANSWGDNWAAKGTAYFLFPEYKPTEAWQVWFNELPQEIVDQKESRAKIKGQILDLLQQIIELVAKL